MQISSSRAACLTFALLVVLSCGCAERRARHRAMDHRELAAQRLGETIQAHGVGAFVVVLGNPFTREKDRPPEIYAFQKVALAGLDRSRLDVAEMVYPEMTPEAAANPLSVRMPTGTTTPLSYLAVPNAFDRVIAEHPNASVLISLVGLPARPADCEFWRNKSGPPLALLLPDLWMIGDANAIRGAFHSGRILSAVVRRPKGLPAADGADAFDQNYLLVTAETVDDVVRSLPGLSTRR